MNDELQKIKTKLDFAEQVLPLTGQTAFSSEIPSTIIGEPPTIAVYAGEDTFMYRTMYEPELCRTGVEISLQNSTDHARFLEAYNDADGGIPADIKNMLDRLIKLGGKPKEADFEFVVEDAEE